MYKKCASYFRRNSDSECFIPVPLLHVLHWAKIRLPSLYPLCPNIVSPRRPKTSQTRCPWQTLLLTSPSGVTLTVPLTAEFALSSRAPSIAREMPLKCATGWSGWSRLACSLVSPALAIASVGIVAPGVVGRLAALIDPRPVIAGGSKLHQALIEKDGSYPSLSIFTDQRIFLDNGVLGGPVVAVGFEILLELGSIARSKEE